MIRPSDPAPRPANLKATAILDANHPAVKRLVEELAAETTGDIAFLRRAHIHLVHTLSAVYSLDEWQPASKTLEKQRGSCSQRMACLEAVARAVGIATRVHAFGVKGSFWYPRFKVARFFIPKRILLVWPQFLVDGAWLDFDELHAPVEQLAASATHGFTNEGESLFEAVQSTPVDFVGKTCGLACAKPEHNLSKFVEADEGFFDTRDEAFQRLGSLQYSLRGRTFEALYGDRKSF
jgi:hypothetical protein